jgi:hypothetical protein
MSNLFDESINKYVKENKFYSHIKVLDKLNKWLINRTNKSMLDILTLSNEELEPFIKDTFIERTINSYTNYNIILHHFCNVIYNNPTDYEKIINIGKEIDKMGGIAFLSIVHDILRYFSPYTNNKYGQVQCKIIENKFQLVNKLWKA